MTTEILATRHEDFKTAAIVSSGLVLPFMILESVNGRNFPHDFPIVLFGLMWLMTLVFTVITLSFRRSLESGTRTVVESIGLMSKVVTLILIAWMWLSLVVDQMPCFLGVPNCD